MKKIFFLAAFSVFLFSCETEENLISNDNDTANATTQVDLRKMNPNASLDTQSDGMYAGIIATNNGEFHGKLWISLHNDQQYSAMVETKEGELHYFELLNTFNDTYSFANSNGSFEFNASNPKDTEISNVFYNGTSGVARVLKETSKVRMTPILGTYDNFFTGAATGTWNFIAQDQAGVPFNAIEEAIITKSGGMMFVESLADGDFEGGLPGCYDFGGPVVALFANYPNTDDILDDPMTPEDEFSPRDFAIYAINQVLVLPSIDYTIIYDLGFSQDVADSNSGNYNAMWGFPQGTNPAFFDPVLDPGCYEIDFGNNGHGAYLQIDNASSTVIGAGNITIALPGLVSTFNLGETDSSSYQKVTAEFQLD